MGRFPFNAPSLRRLGILLPALAFSGVVVAVQREPAPGMMAGVAKVDITPAYPILLSGYAGRTTESEGVGQPLFAKALAFGTAREDTAVLVTVDNVGVPGTMTEEVYKRVSAKEPFPRANFTVCSSHTHNGPMLTGVLPFLFSRDIEAAQQAVIDRYSAELTDKLEQVVLSAIRDRKLATVTSGEGKAGFARNRRPQGGPVDQSLPVLAVHGPDGKLRAMLANYACHCTTLSSNTHGGDWAGFAQEYMERDHPGSTAMISIGCGADANPHPMGSLQAAQAQGREIANEVSRLLGSPMKPLTRTPEGALSHFNLPYEPLPDRPQWEALALKPGITGYHARKNLERLDRGETLPTALPYSVQTWKFGRDLAMVFLPGEVVVDYSLGLKKEFDNLWVTAYANDVPCYIPSTRILKEGGYEGGGAMAYYDRPARLGPSTEDKILGEVRKLLPEFFRAREARAAFGKAQANGVARITSASTFFDYTSWLGVLPFAHCHQTDGKSHVIWETAAAPDELEPGKSQVFRFPGGMGHLLQPAGSFELKVNGTRVLDFGVELNDHNWSNAGGKVRMSYEVKEAGAQDSNGIFTVQIENALLTAGEPVVFEVTGSATKSLRWFGVYSLSKDTVALQSTESQPPGRELIDLATPDARRMEIIRRHPERSAEILQEMILDLTPGTTEESRRIPWIWNVTIAAARRNEAEEIRSLLEISLPQPGAPLHDWQAVVIGGGLINGISQAGPWPGERIREIIGKNEELLARWHQSLHQALGMADDGKIPHGTRYDALRMTPLLPWEKCAAQLVKYLAKDKNAELQQGAVSGLADVDHPEAASQLVKAFAGLTDSNKTFALDALLRSPERIDILLEAIAAKKITRSDLGEERIAKLASLEDLLQRARARELLSTF